MSCDDAETIYFLFLISYKPMIYICFLKIVASLQHAQLNVKLY